MTIEYLVGTAIAAFFASLAAVVLGFTLNRGEKRRDARAEMLRAIARQIDRLWAYSTAHGEARIAGINNARTVNGDFAPFKPSAESLSAEISAVLPYFNKRARRAVLETLKCVDTAAVPNEKRSMLADWQSESRGLVLLATRVAKWNGKAGSLPA